MAGEAHDFSPGSSGLVSGTEPSWAATPWLLETEIPWPHTCSSLLVGDLPPQPLRGLESTVHSTNLCPLKRLETVLAVYLTHQPSAVSKNHLQDTILDKGLLWVTLERMENGCLECRENNTTQVVMRIRNNKELSTCSLRDLNLRNLHVPQCSYL